MDIFEILEKEKDTDSKVMQIKNDDKKKDDSENVKHKGVSWYKRTNRWVVQTKVGKRLLHLGYFIDKEDAKKKHALVIKTKLALQKTHPDQDDLYNCLKETMEASP